MTADVGRMLDISRQGAQQLTVREHDFPEPIGKLGHYTIWWRPEVEEWIRRHRLAYWGRRRLCRVAPREKLGQ